MSALLAYIIVLALAAFFIIAVRAEVQDWRDDRAWPDAVTRLGERETDAFI